jgi:hypothetical protein
MGAANVSWTLEPCALFLQLIPVETVKVRGLKNNPIEALRKSQNGGGDEPRPARRAIHHLLAQTGLEIEALAQTADQRRTE